MVSADINHSDTSSYLTGQNQRLKLYKFVSYNRSVLCIKCDKSMLLELHLIIKGEGKEKISSCVDVASPVASHFTSNRQISESVFQSFENVIANYGFCRNASIIQSGFSVQKTACSG